MRKKWVTKIISICLAACMLVTPAMAAGGSAADADAVKETASEAVSGGAAAAENVLEAAAAAEAASENESVPQDEKTSEESIPEESASEESTPEENVPEESTPEENVPEENVPDGGSAEETPKEDERPVAGDTLPVGVLDDAEGRNGSIYVRGWAFDRDALSESVTVKVYIGGTYASGAPGYAIKADQTRADVDQAYPGVGENHGFEAEIEVSLTGSYTLYVYAINIGGGESILIGTKDVLITTEGAEITSSDLKTPGVLNVGDDFEIVGTVASGIELTDISVGCYDIDGKLCAGASVDPEGCTYDLSGLDAEIAFDTLAPDLYYYCVTASNAQVTVTLMKKAFSVLAHPDNESTKSRIETIYRFLLDELGCNEAVACGIISNIEMESGFKWNATYAETNGYLSYGLCQWTNSRLNNLRNYCRENNYDFMSITGQLYFLKYELMGGGGEAAAWSHMQGISNTADGCYTAGYRWAQWFERCAHYYNGIDLYDQRGARAKALYWPEYGVKDEEPPVISDVRVTELDETGYTVSCTATDNAQIRCVKFPTWTEYNGQDDLDQTWMSTAVYDGTKNGDTYTFRVNTSDHNGESGTYITHIYAYDANDNQTIFGVNAVQVPDGSGERIISLNKEYSGVMPASGTAAVYRVNIPRSGLVTVVSSGSWSGGRMELKEASTGTVVDTTAIAAGNGYSVTDSIYLNKGLYCVRFVKDNTASSGDYRLKVTLAPSYESYNETYGGIYNDFASSRAISLGRSYRAQLSADDMSDCVKFAVSSDQTINLHFAAQTAGMTIGVYDSSGNSVYSVSPSSGTNNISAVYSMLLPKGIYYLKFTAASRAQTGFYQYTLRATLTKVRVLPSTAKIAAGYDKAFQVSLVNEPANVQTGYAVRSTDPSVLSVSDYDSSSGQIIGSAKKAGMAYITVYLINKKDGAVITSTTVPVRVVNR